MNTCIDHGNKPGKDAYASCYYEGRYIGKHVRALILATGEQSDGRHALHSCDNKRCINPKHLRWGTRSNNMADAVDRGQHVNNLSNFDQTTNRRRGVEQTNARWNTDDVLQMRELYAAGMKQTEIAAYFKCRQSDVSRIVRNELWRHA